VFVGYDYTRLRDEKAAPIGSKMTTFNLDRKVLVTGIFLTFGGQHGK